MLGIEFQLQYISGFSMVKFDKIQNMPLGSKVKVKKNLKFMF